MCASGDDSTPYPDQPARSVVPVTQLVRLLHPRWRDCSLGANPEQPGGSQLDPVVNEGRATELGGGRRLQGGEARTGGNGQKMGEKRVSLPQGWTFDIVIVLVLQGLKRTPKKSKFH